MDKFSHIEEILLRVKETARSGALPPGLLEEFGEACLRGYVDDLRDQQLSVLFNILNQVESLVKERDVSITPVTSAREMLLFVLENNES